MLNPPVSPLIKGGIKGGCFGFNVANYVLISVPDSKVRIPGISLFWQCCYIDISSVDGFGIITNESLKAGIITFLSCITPIGNFKYSFLIGFEHFLPVR